MSEQLVDANDVNHVADLARIELTADEVEAFREQFTEILSYFERLEEVPQTESESDLVNVFRPDEVRPSLSQAEALSNAPETEDGSIKGPRVS